MYMSRSSPRNGLKDYFRRLEENDATLTEIDFSKKKIGYEGVMKLANALKSNTTLQKLDLLNNNICPQGAVALVHAMEENNSLPLHTLSLRNNSIGNDGALALAHALVKNTTLQTLELYHNGIGDLGASALAKALESNRTLERLELDWNNIGEEGATALLHVLQNHNRTLASIGLFNRGVPSWLKEQIEELVSRNASGTSSSTPVRPSYKRHYDMYEEEQQNAVRGRRPGTFAPSFGHIREEEEWMVCLAPTHSGFAPASMNAAEADTARIDKDKEDNASPPQPLSLAVPISTCLASSVASRQEPASLTVAPEAVTIAGQGAIIRTTSGAHAVSGPDSTAMDDDGNVSSTEPVVACAVHGNEDNVAEMLQELDRRRRDCGSAVGDQEIDVDEEAQAWGTPSAFKQSTSNVCGPRRRCVVIAMLVIILASIGIVLGVLLYRSSVN